MRIGTCRRCKARVVMARHVVTRKFAPIEVDPSPDGNISITGDTYEIVPAEQRQSYKDRGFPLRKNHFATCEFAKTFARRIAKRKAMKVSTGR